MKPGEPVTHNDACVLLRAVQRKLRQPLTMRTIADAVSCGSTESGADVG